MHDRAARTQWSDVDKYGGATKISDLIVRLARSSASALSFPPIAINF
jgi:hypothetical protein